MPGDWRRRIVRVSVDNNFSTGILDQASGNLAPGSSREWSIALTEPHDCPFCAIDPDRIAFSSTLGHVIWDAFPVSPGHMLIVPSRHVATWEDLTDPEKADLVGC